MLCRWEIIPALLFYKRSDMTFSLYNPISFFSYTQRFITLQHSLMKKFASILPLVLIYSLGWGQPGQFEKRIALVIGNSNYELSPLINPVNDARAMNKTLSQLGFEVIYKTDATLVEMKKAIREFGEKLAGGGTGLFYYAGHGIQVSGENYLIPVDAKIYREEEVEYESVNAGFVLAQMAGAKNRMNIMILDACRNNPFARNFRSQQSGWASMNAPMGTLIAYATTPGSTASDGTGENGLYTQELLKQIKVSGLMIEEVFKNVRANVINISNGLQVPWESSSLIGNFYFVSTSNSYTGPDLSEQDHTTTTLSSVHFETGQAYDESIKVLTPTVKAKWKRAGESFYFLKDGVNISSRIISSWAGNHLLAYDPTSNQSFLLNDYALRDDDTYKPAIEIFSLSATFWRKDAAGYYLYTNGKQVQKDTKNTFAGNDLLVYDENSSSHYLLKNYANVTDSKIRATELLYSPTSAFWRAGSTGYFVYYKGQSIQMETSNSFDGDDLIVYHEHSGLTFLLKDYNNRKDNVLRTAELYKPSYSIQWEKNGNTFTIYDEGFHYQEAESFWIDEHLGVYDKATRTYYFLENYATQGEQILYNAEVLKTEEGIAWRRKENTYWFYINGTQNTLPAQNSFSNGDLLVFIPGSITTYLFKDYDLFKDEKFHPGKILSRTETAFWRAVDNTYWLYNKGKLLMNTEAEWDGNDVKVRDKDTGIMFLLPGFVNLQDNQLRAAILKGKY